MPTVPISDETYRRLQSLAIPFEDKEVEDVIVRLLNQEKEGRPPSGTQGNGVEVNLNTQPSDLVSHVGSVPHGSLLRATYKGREYQAEINDGRVVWNGQRFRSLSEAAVAVIQSTGSKRPTENGWRFWEVRLPGTAKWRPGTDLRD